MNARLQFADVLRLGPTADSSIRALVADMDAWGYTFRLGNARAWFESDAADACIWLRQNGVIDDRNHPTFRTRQ